jgi:hypothetical protein
MSREGISVSDRARITGASLSAGLGSSESAGGRRGGIIVPSFSAKLEEKGERDGGPPERDRQSGANALDSSPPQSPAGERFDPDASIELEAAAETRDILGDLRAASGRQESPPPPRQQQRRQQQHASPVSLEAATTFATERVDAEMQRIEQMLNAKTRDTCDAVRVRARMRPGPAVVHEARLQQQQQQQQQQRPDGDDHPYQDVLAALTLNDDDVTGDNDDWDEEKEPEVTVKVLARHCTTSWQQQQNAPKKWGCHVVHCTLPRSVGKKASDILRHVTQEIGCLVAIDENGGRLHIKDEDHALYQKEDARPLQGDDVCASSRMLHHCSVAQEIEDGCADKQGSVDLSHREFNEIPAALLDSRPKGTRPALLNLSHNKLSSIPSRFFLDREHSRLRQLHSLLLAGNMLRLVPPGLDELVGLRVLSLSNNRLAELPWEIGKLGNLRSLYLDHNRLSNLPWEIRSLTCLEELQLGSNQLTRFPSRVLGLSGLKRLGLARNRIACLPGTIGGDGDLRCLESLDLTSNCIAHLPDGIGSLRSLKRLFLASNRIRSVPDAWAPLRKSLKAIFLGGNKGLTVSPAWVEEVPGDDRQGVSVE